ncbi:Protein LURP-one-related 15 [Morella rubra]|uniref:Protein LURP-one-related 15 n=1 Tax=Morella rubra TaxID=262757 RepID=A0A6A1WJC7_9ROSI|nr:Protein LURP-one-related 15 [Morella rubra]
MAEPVQPFSFTPPAPTGTQFATSSVAIINPQYCSPDPVDLTIVRKIMTAHQRWKVFRGESVKPKDLIFSVKRSAIIQPRATLHVFLAKNTKEDVCDFRVESDFLRSSCTIYAGQSSIIVAQMMSAHDRWQVFRGESVEPSDLIFSVKRSSMFQLKVKLHVFLANNTKEDVCDFRVEGIGSKDLVPFMLENLPHLLPDAQEAHCSKYFDRKRQLHGDSLS